MSKIVRISNCLKRGRECIRGPGVSGYLSLYVAILTNFFCWRYIGVRKDLAQFPQTPMPYSRKG